MCDRNVGGGSPVVLVVCDKNVGEGLNPSFNPVVKQNKREEVEAGNGGMKGGWGKYGRGDVYM